MSVVYVPVATLSVHQLISLYYQTNQSLSTPYSQLMTKYVK